MKQTILLSSLCAGLLCGCADVRIAEYQRPDAPTKSSWSRQPEATPSASATISPPWWNQVGGTYLGPPGRKGVAGDFGLEVHANRT